MSKKLIFWLIVVAIAIAMAVLVKVYPLWVSLQNILVLAAGLIFGWWGKMFYDRYIKPISNK